MDSKTANGSRMVRRSPPGHPLHYRIHYVNPYYPPLRKIAAHRNAKPRHQRERNFARETQKEIYKSIGLSEDMAERLLVEDEKSLSTPVVPATIGRAAAPVGPNGPAKPRRLIIHGPNRPDGTPLIPGRPIIRFVGPEKIDPDLLNRLDGVIKNLESSVSPTHVDDSQYAAASQLQTPPNSVKSSGSGPPSPPSIILRPPSRSSDLSSIAPDISKLINAIDHAAEVIELGSKESQEASSDVQEEFSLLRKTMISLVKEFQRQVVNPPPSSSDASLPNIANGLSGIKDKLDSLVKRHDDILSVTRQASEYAEMSSLFWKLDAEFRRVSPHPVRFQVPESIPERYERRPRTLLIPKLQYGNTEFTTEFLNMWCALVNAEPSSFQKAYRRVFHSLNPGQIMSLPKIAASWIQFVCECLGVTLDNHAFDPARACHTVVAYMVIRPLIIFHTRHLTRQQGVLYEDPKVIAMAAEDLHKRVQELLWRSKLKAWSVNCGEPILASHYPGNRYYESGTSVPGPWLSSLGMTGPLTTTHLYFYFMYWLDEAVSFFERFMKERTPQNEKRVDECLDICSRLFPVVGRIFMGFRQNDHHDFTNAQEADLNAIKTNLYNRVQRLAAWVPLSSRWIVTSPLAISFPNEVEFQLPGVYPSYERQFAAAGFAPVPTPANPLAPNDAIVSPLADDVIQAGISLLNKEAVHPRNSDNFTSRYSASLSSGEVRSHPPSLASSSMGSLPALVPVATGSTLTSSSATSLHSSNAADDTCYLPVILRFPPPTNVPAANPHANEVMQPRLQYPEPAYPPSYRGNDVVASVGVA
ncbi:hypothetical protein DL93DRAFT_2192430 [Clavulina sp. PMI_390]|nr:hypothetical protein DL93DRAFT_2192430 [Clavulina sp. PMI_390]